jgi:outer membrane protein W
MNSKLLITSLAAAAFFSGSAVAEDNFYEAGRWFVDGAIALNSGDQKSSEGHNNDSDIDKWDLEVSYSVIDNATIGVRYQSEERDISSVGGFHNLKSNEKSSGFGIEAAYHFQIAAMPQLRPFVSVGYLDTSNKMSETTTFSGFPNAADMNESDSSKIDMSGMVYRIGASYTVTNNFAVRASYGFEDLDGSGNDHDGRHFMIGLVVAI